MSLIGDKFVFIHVPHTGGTSIRSQLSGDEFGMPHTIFRSIPDELLKGKISFGIVRNPVNWFISKYNYILKTENHYDKPFAESFRGYLEYYIGRLKDETFDFGSDHYCTQSDYLNGCDEVIFFDNPKKCSLVSKITGANISPVIKLNRGENRIVPSESEINVIKKHFIDDYNLIKKITNEQCDSVPHKGV